jgi:hypothetical protein
MTLEELLNKLIERGWRPNWEYIWPHKPYICPYKDRRHWIQFYYNEWWDGEYGLEKVFSLRDIVSKESWLWQYVCENGMLKKRWEYRAKRRHLHWWEHDEDVYHDTSYTKNDYEYFIIESALCDEDKLEQFLLNNIKIDEI